MTSQMPNQPSRNLSVNKSICLYVGANTTINEPKKKHRSKWAYQ